jgi:hypothetical protein
MSICLVFNADPKQVDIILIIIKKPFLGNREIWHHRDSYITAMTKSRVNDPIERIGPSDDPDRSTKTKQELPSCKADLSITKERSIPSPQ